MKIITKEEFLIHRPQRYEVNQSLKSILEQMSSSIHFRPVKSHTRNKSSSWRQTSSVGPAEMNVVFVKPQISINKWSRKEELLSDDVKLRKQIISQLNKLSELNYRKILNNIKELLHSDTQSENILAEEILRKTIDDKGFHDIYCRLIKECPITTKIRFDKLIERFTRIDELVQCKNLIESLPISSDLKQRRRKQFQNYFHLLGTLCEHGLLTAPTKDLLLQIEPCDPIWIEVLVELGKFDQTRQLIISRLTNLDLTDQCKRIRYMVEDILNMKSVSKPSLAASELKLTDEVIETWWNNILDDPMKDQYWKQYYDLCEQYGKLHIDANIDNIFKTVILSNLDELKIDIPDIKKNLKLVLKKIETGKKISDKHVF